MTRSRNNFRRGTQRGAALVVALLIVAMVVMLATALSSDFLLMFRRVENQLYSEQAYAYLQGAEELARAALLQDMQRDGDKHNDNLAEPWAEERRFPTDYGWIVGQIEDLGGRFNVNGLVSRAAQSGTADTHSPVQNQFIRLLLTLKLDEPLGLDQAEALTEAITDWIDGNDEVDGLGGAESQYYAQAEPIGRAADRAIASPSELLWVKGMTPEIYRALAPLITVWPQKISGEQGAAINLNTAPAQVLRSLGNAKETQPLSDSEVDYLLQDRSEHKYFADTAIVKTGILKDKQIDETSVAVTSSNYFMLRTTTEFQGHRYSMQSLLHRRSDIKPARVDVEARTYGEW
jgi:general secretion pathway protein K